MVESEFIKIRRGPEDRDFFNVMLWNLTLINISIITMILIIELYGL